MGVNTHEDVYRALMSLFGKPRTLFAFDEWATEKQHTNLPKDRDRASSSQLAHNLRPLTTTQHPGGAAFVSDDQSTAGIVSSVTSNRHNWLLGYEAEDFCKKVLHLQEFQSIRTWRIVLFLFFFFLVRSALLLARCMS